MKGNDYYMNEIYRIKRAIIENILSDLGRMQYTEDGQTPEYSYDAIESPYKILHYNDYAFKSAMGRLRANETVDDILQMLKKKGLVDKNADFNRVKFRKLSHKIIYNFLVPWLSFTPVMERLIYMLTYVKQPKNVMAIGISSGYTLAWIGSACDLNRTRIYGVEKDGLMLSIAKDNFRRYKMEQIELHCGDGLEYLNKFPDEMFDLIFIDTRKNIDILKTAEKKLVKNGWLMQHNASDIHMVREIKQFLDFVRDEKHFSYSVLFDVDIRGLELSVK